MVSVSDSIVLDRSPAELFAIVADPQSQLIWDAESLKQVEALTPGPLGKGSRYRGTFSGLGVVEYEYAEYEPPTRFAHRSIVRMGEIYHTFEFEPLPEGTRLTHTSTLRARGLWRLLAPMMRRVMQNRLRAMSIAIRDYLAAQ